MTTRLGSTRWAPLLALTAILSACGAAAPRAPATEPATMPEPTTPEPAAQQASCDDAAIRLPGRGTEVDGAIIADTLHMGGFTAPATCTEPTTDSLLALSLPEDLTAQVRQSQYYLIVIRYPGGNRLYIVTRRGDGTSCVVDLNDECIAQVTDLPDDFDLEDLPDDAPPTIPGGRPAPPTVSPPPAPSEPATPTEPAARPAAAPGAAWFPDPSDGATNVGVRSDGSVSLIWEPGHSGGRGGPSATSYDVYWGTAKNLAADAELGTPIRTTTVTVDIQPLALDTTYYWRVDANNAAGTTRGNVWSFTTRTAGASPAPSAGAPRAVWFPWPSDEATDVDVHDGLVNLIWEPGHSGGRGGPTATSYDVYWGTTQNLAADATLDTPIRTSLIIQAIQGLAFDTTYYWRVDANNAAGTTRGNVWSFTTRAAPAPAPAAPAPAPPPAEEPPAAAPGAAWFPDPSDGATNVSVRADSSVYLIWEPGESGGRGGARTDSYDVYWGTTRNLAGTPIRTTTVTVDIQPLAFNTTYYWRVDANNAAGTTRGNVWSFTTGAAP